jgi:S-adenosylmethionine decarboxylase
VKSLGKHLIVECHGCDRELINDTERIEAVMLEAARKAGATLVDHRFHRFSPHGVSGMVIVAESHFAIHTWPEYGYCAIDFFTCGDLTDNHAALAVITQGLRSSHHSAMEMRRGILDLPEDQIKHKPDSCRQQDGPAT